MATFLSLHNRSSYSFCSALTTPEQLAEFARRWGMQAIAVTDVDGLYAALPFQRACERVGVRPIFGAELRIDLGRNEERPSRAKDQPSSRGFAITLLACDLVGYGNLCRLVSTNHLRENPLDADDLLERSQGLICLIGHPCADGDRRASSSPSHATSRDP